MNTPRGLRTLRTGAVVLTVSVLGWLLLFPRGCALIPPDRFYRAILELPDSERGGVRRGDTLLEDRLYQLCTALNGASRCRSTSGARDRGRLILYPLASEGSRPILVSLRGEDAFELDGRLYRMRVPVDYLLWLAGFETVPPEFRSKRGTEE